MLNFTTRKTFLVPSFDLDAKEEEKMDRFLYVLEKSKIAELFPFKDETGIDKGGRPHYSYYDMLATILYGFAFGSPTLRDLETSCRYDLRYFYLMQQERPGHSLFGIFINDFILSNRKEIFKRITSAIIEELKIDTDDCFIDGSKFEADANKYKFVWKPTTYHNNLSDKIRVLLNDVGLYRGVPKKGFISSKLIAEKISELSAIKDMGRYYEDRYGLLNKYLIKALEYEEKERICGEGRNSYYKTDHDATAMTLKADYYAGLGSSMHAAYNTQLLVSKGIICACHVSQSRNDGYDFIPVLKAFKDNFGHYPKRVCADAGYGYLENYRFLHRHNIENYVKHQSFQGNVSGRNPDRYFLNEDATITCLNGFIGSRIEMERRHPKKAGSIFYRIKGCNGCSFRLYCKRFMNDKDEDFRIFEVQEELILYKQEAFENLLTPKGIEMRVNRSSQVEGAFGVIKEDMNYTRLRRTSLEKVETEFLLTYLGYNIRKLFRYFEGKARLDYWKAPDDLKPEVKKKPSAKRLSKKASKKKNKSVNEEAKKYKYNSKKK
ncbi:MAG: transposase [Erysipelotrichaceae bacterium]|nr:transposase [Erysipelotrichaceae bacterium]